MKNKLLFLLLVLLLVLFSAVAFYYVWQEKKPQATVPEIEMPVFAK